MQLDDHRFSVCCVSLSPARTGGSGLRRDLAAGSSPAACPGGAGGRRGCGRPRQPGAARAGAGEPSPGGGGEYRIAKIAPGH